MIRRVLILFLVILFSASFAYAQTAAEIEQQKQRIAEQIEAQKRAEQAAIEEQKQRIDEQVNAAKSDQSDLSVEEQKQRIAEQVEAQKIAEQAAIEQQKQRIDELISGPKSETKQELLRCMCAEGYPCMMMTESGVDSDRAKVHDVTSQIPEGLRNNEYFLESQRLTKLAQETYEVGEYDASAGFAREAVLYAELSDKYVAEQLTAEASRLIIWADENGIESKHPDAYSESVSYYENSIIAQEEKDWNEAIYSAIKSIELLSPYETGRPTVRPVYSGVLPSQYTVRSWGTTGDCLSKIAGYPFIYGDPHKWRILYDANKARFPNPNNPHLLQPGFVLNIPSIQGEERRGMWNHQ